MPTQKWRVIVAKLGASTTLHDGEVDATNWMSALRAARQAMSERPSLPPGASCTVDAQGIATVLDPSSRRKFVLSPVVAMPQPAPGPAAPEVVPEAPKPKRFETAALIPTVGAQLAPQPRVVPPATPTDSRAAAHSGEMQPRRVANAPIPAEPVASGQIPAPPRPTEPAKKRFATVAFVDDQRAEGRSVVVGGPAAPRTEPSTANATATQVSSTLPRASGRAPAAFEIVLERDEDPTPTNPLYYRERAYLLPKSSTVPEAEATLRWKLAELQQALQAAPRGKLINLAVFDHRWRDAPDRPPVIVLQWRDWRDEVTVDYPAAARVSSTSDAPHDDRLADVFEALEELHQLRSAAEGLDFAVRLLERTIPSEATSACLYDINTDELRFVAVAGSGAAGMQGRAVPRSAGLFGQAVRIEHHASVFDVSIEPAFDSVADGRAGLEARNELLRPVAHEHQLLGMLQLINRKETGIFTAQDIAVINYIAERLADFLYAARQRQLGHA